MSRVDGYVFHNDEPLWEGDALAPVEAAVRHGLLSELNGSFGAICDGTDTLTLVTDRVGSRPIFYARGRDGWVADFDAWAVVRQLPTASLDREAAHELLAFSFALGSRTLVSQVSEAPAGSRVDLDADGAHVLRYWPVRGSEHRPRVSTSEFASVIERTADRTAALARSLTAGPVGVALSGGRDSRLVGWMLRSRDIDIACYTTAALGEAGPVVAQVAAALGAPLTTFRPWYEAGGDPDDEMVAALSLTTMFGVANHTLTLAHEGPPEVVHVPGHLGDVPAGSYIDGRSIIASARSGRSAGLILTKHRRVGPKTLRQVLGGDAEDRLRDRITEVLEGEPRAMGAERKFQLDQRQRRFILRDNMASRQRFSTFLPLMDAEWLDLWESVPVTQLMGTALYERTLADEIFVGRWLPLAQIPANGRPLGAAVRRHALPSLVEDFSKKVKRQVQLRTGRAPAVLAQQVPIPADVELLDGTVDVPALRVHWAALGWDAQRSVYTLIDVVTRLQRETDA